MNLADQVYDVSGRWPRSHLFGLTSQVQRAALSVPCNIAEGQGRNSKPAFRRFLDIASGSLNEMETALMMAGRRRLIDDPPLEYLLESSAEVGRLINGLLRMLHTESDPQ